MGEIAAIQSGDFVQKFWLLIWNITSLGNIFFSANLLKLVSRKSKLSFLNGKLHHCLEIFTDLVKTKIIRKFNLPLLFILLSILGNLSVFNQIYKKREILNRVVLYSRKNVYIKRTYASIDSRYFIIAMISKYYNYSYHIF